MAVSIPSEAVPCMLKWARESAGMTLEFVSDAEKIPIERLQEWESDSSELSPSLSKLRALSKRYKRPLMVFYLPSPPKNFAVVKDFRSLPGGVSAEFSPELRFAIRQAQERQQWAASYLEESGADESELVGSVQIKDDTEEVAANLRSLLDVSMQSQVECRTPADGLALWRSACESVGVFVFQASGVAVDEMRGCALPNKFAPVALLNAKDSPTAKTFTLIHEMAHILLGEASISGGGTSATAPRPVRVIESFCNSIAAEVLVPKSDFLARIPRDWQSYDDAVISEMAKRYCVSRAVIGMRLVETGLADSEYLRNKWKSLQSKPEEPREGPIPQHYLALARTGQSFARLALNAYHSGAIHGGELSGLMRMKLNHLPKLESRLYPNRAHPTA